MQRQSQNYIANCLIDIKKGINQIEQTARSGEVALVLERIKAVKLDLELLGEGLQAIEGQQILEV